MDPVFLEVVGNHLAATAEEMGLGLIRSAYSPNIRERRDCSCAVFDAEGRIISQAEHIPVHLGPMANAVRCLKASHWGGAQRPGDVFVYNDAYLPGGSHLPDVTMLAPVFIDGRIAFHVASRAHHSDIGGIVPGSMGIEAKEIFHEGLRIPLVRMVAEGTLVEDVVSFVCMNSRSPDERRGDLFAQWAALEVGRGRLEEFARRHDHLKVDAHIRALADLARQGVRDVLDGLPPGPFVAEDRLEFDEERVLTIRVRVRIDERGLAFDFTGTDPQVHSPYNMPCDAVRAAGYYVLKCLLGPDVPFNYGVLDCTSFVLPFGTLVNPRPPAPVSLCTSESPNRVVDVILAALGQVVPDRVTAGWATTRNIMIFSGTRPDGSTFIHLETFGGGQGGRLGKDGLDGVPPHLGNTANMPTEIMEDIYPLRGVRFALRRDSEGPGQYRGGLGLVREIEIGDVRGARLTILSDRRRFPAAGFRDGGPGAVGAQWLIRHGVGRLLPAKGTVDLEPSDIVCMETPGGGGYGAVGQRPRSLAHRDVGAGLVSAARGRDVYGVE